MRKSYTPPAIVFETKLHTRAGGSTEFSSGEVPGLEFDPTLPGKPEELTSSNDGSIDTLQPIKPGSSSSSGGSSDGSFDRPMPPKPSP